MIRVLPLLLMFAVLATAQEKKEVPEKNDLDARIKSQDAKVKQAINKGDLSKIVLRLSEQETLFREKWPEGSTERIGILLSMSHVSDDLGDTVKAERYATDAWKMLETLHQAKKLPENTRISLLIDCVQSLLRSGAYPNTIRSLELAFQDVKNSSMNDRQKANLNGQLKNLQGMAYHGTADYEKAQQCYQESIDILKTILPENSRSILVTRFNLAAVSSDIGKNDEAVKIGTEVYEEYKKSSGTQASKLSMMSTLSRNLGLFLGRAGQPEKSKELLKESLKYKEQLYPPSKHPNGHPLIFETVIDMSESKSSKMNQEFHDLLSHYLDQARKYFNVERYPDGNRTLLMLQYVYAQDLYLFEKNELALPIIRECMQTNRRLLEAAASSSSEAQALNFAAKMPGAQHILMNVTRKLKTSPDQYYGDLWGLKAAITRQLERRQESIVLSSNPQIQAKATSLKEVRLNLSRALLAASANRTSEQEKHLEELNREKELLESELASLLPDFRKSKDYQSETPEELAKLLPANGAFVDLVRYMKVDDQAYRSGKPWNSVLIPHYAAFIIRRNKPIVRIELGKASEIDEAILAWKNDLFRDQQNTESSKTLRQRVWQPMIPALEGVSNLWITAEGAFLSLPWGAIPGDKQPSILLEDYTFQTVLHGPHLLQRFREVRAKTPSGKALIVGGVDYSVGKKQPAPRSNDATTRSAPALTGKPKWDNLPGTKDELDQVSSFANAIGLQVLARSGENATPQQLMADLGDTRILHIATHGFFADKQFRSALNLDETKFLASKRENCMLRERFEVGSRNPLALSGLVLSGANDERAADQGILTAEDLVNTSLRQLDLAVLSACETGLGDVAGGEGVYGLQRAFHLAGARNVVSTLWKVDDRATAAMMTVFYRAMWVEGKPPAAALREAQLYLYRNPATIAQLSKTRGPDFKKTIEVPKSTNSDRAPAKLWAAFTLSGIGN